MTKITGGCQCGAVRYETDATPMMAVHCQCTDCRKASGAGHVTAAAFPADAVKFSGKTKSYSSKADSGASVSREFCPECGGRLTFRSANMPGMVAIAAGSMDSPESIQPTVAFYQKRHVAWDHLDPAMPTFEAGPPRQ